MRSRVLDASFFTDPDVRKLSPLGRLLLVGLWCYVDDYGNGLWLPAAIEGAVFPYEPVDILGLLLEVERAGFVARYWVRGQQCFAVRNFDKYQKPRHKSTTKVPAPSTQVDWDDKRPKPAPTLGSESSPKSAGELAHGIGIGIGKGIDIGKVPAATTPQALPEPEPEPGLPRPGWLQEMQQRRVGQ